MNCSAFVAVRALRGAINQGNAPWRSYASTTKVSKAKQSSGGGAVNVDSKKIDPPQTVFKKVDPKGLGPGASKQGDYKNPEYFSYHNMTYAEMDVVMEKLRVPQPSAKTK